LATREIFAATRRMGEEPLRKHLDGQRLGDLD
jgi:hypothetical protein